MVNRIFNSFTSNPELVTYDSFNNICFESLQFASNQMGKKDDWFSVHTDFPLSDCVDSYSFVQVNSRSAISNRKKGSIFFSNSLCGQIVNWPFAWGKKSDSLETEACSLLFFGFCIHISVCASHFFMVFLFINEKFPGQKKVNLRNTVGCRSWCNIKNQKFSAGFHPLRKLRSRWINIAFAEKGIIQLNICKY